MADDIQNNDVNNDSQSVQGADESPDSKSLVQDTKSVSSNESSESPTNEGGKTFSADYVEQLRKENASWRTKLRDVEGKVDQLTEQLRQEKIQQTKLATIQEFGLPADAMEFLTGKDAETIKAQAEKFKSLIPDAPEAGSQQTPRRAISALPGGEPREETREEKNRRLGISSSAGGNTIR